MKKRPIIIDTDPGIDDAIAIGAALFSEELDIKLISTVAGNVGIEQVTENALKLLSFWNKRIPVARGSAGPLLVSPINASDVHGASGMDGYDFPPPDRSNLLAEHGVNAIYRVLRESDVKITLAPIGPLTNIALLLRMYPDAKEKIEEIVLMGGSMNRGNKGVMAEFNILCDPEAARIVFESGLPIVMAGLDVGLKALVRPEDAAKLKGMGRTGEMVYALLHRYRSNGGGNTSFAMYDSCAIAYILQPQLFEVAETYVGVETAGTLTAGTTVVDLKGLLKRKPNAKVCTDINGELFSDWLLSALRRCN
ncbi:ribonucleoside hydrolase RihC [Spirochaetia bacterium]|nr:ribonucleoside hydrolase RihC [Spirochaetia bacterium]